MELGTIGPFWLSIGSGGISGYVLTVVEWKEFDMQERIGDGVRMSHPADCRPDVGHCLEILLGELRVFDSLLSLHLKYAKSTFS